ncbi:stalk domain-containing protein [Paenibacillus methanolicus]|uniref:Copper amine oxidase-like protein n=1 Tax=Paenibacillus methanolicus TaxID=582686 RepID=A0A5S5CJY8_9BACL|nr:stalk domain-containing protein [Paenibacillus methanolicus]TYP79814.1 copper amine oxidase-like protein [Paenibacillus methanolicus]
MKKKWIAAGAAGIFLLSASAGVYAGNNLQQIKAFLDPSMKFLVNGKPFQPQNDKGAALAPISYNGSTYLPVRAISNALGVSIEYNGATNTVILGEKLAGVPIADSYGNSGSQRTKDPQSTSYNGKDYKDVHFNNLKGARSDGFMLYPKGKYQKLVLQTAAIGEDIEEFFVSDSDSDVRLKSDSIAVADGLKTYEIDISGYESLFVHAKIKDGGSFFVPLTTSYYK